ncbi:MAG: sulfotransferase domain-containing protein [Candidatus Promineifilaceae bacterium]
MKSRIMERFRPKATLISFPKCGRTWLRVMLGKAFYLHYGVDDLREDGTRFLYPEGVYENLKMPRIDFTHDDNPHRKEPYEIEDDKTKYRDKKVILLIRDLRDVMVSNYYEEVYRRPTYDDAITKEETSQTLSQFLNRERGGVESFLKFYNNWALNRHVPKDVLLLRYENLQHDTVGELLRIISFLGLRGTIKRGVIEDAVAFASFQNMQRMERDGLYKHSARLRPGDVNNLNSYKVRSGKVGGYRTALNEDDCAQLTNKLLKSLSPYYGYFD